MTKHLLQGILPLIVFIGSGCSNSVPPDSKPSADADGSDADASDDGGDDDGEDDSDVDDPGDDDGGDDDAGDDDGGPIDTYEGDSAGECSDDADNDRDGLFDCDDPGCAGSDVCSDDADADDSIDTADGGDDTASPEDADADADGSGEDTAPPTDTSDESDSGIDTDGDDGADTTAGEETGGEETGGDETGGDETGGDETGGEETGGDETGGDDGDLPVPDLDGDGFTALEGDCDDGDASVYPGAPEVCDGIDNDCDALPDDGLSFTSYYLDVDGDGYGSDIGAISACGPSDGYVTSGGDCNDSDATVSPGAVEECDGIDNDCDGVPDDSISYSTYYMDADGDGYGDAGTTTYDCVAPSGYVSSAGDCDDSTASITGPMAVYGDADGDGYGEGCGIAVGGSTCALSSVCPGAPIPPGYSASDADCDGSRADVYPGAPELCDGVDNDCDVTVDEGATGSTYYRDADGDGYGDAGTTMSACSAPSGWVTSAGDCNDSDASISPGAPEICDGIDNDCDISIDEGVSMSTYYPDADGDGYGSDSGATSACSAPAGHVTVGGDCDDTRSAVSPGAMEVCDEIDNDCDSSIDEGVAAATYYLDSDGDGWGDSSTSRYECSAPSGYVATAGDCCDANPSTYPGSGASSSSANECGSFDYNCDGSATLTVDAIAACDYTTGALISPGWSSPPACGVVGEYAESCTPTVIDLGSFGGTITIWAPDYATTAAACY